MKTYKDCEVLYLDENDLTAYGCFKPFDDIDVYDFRFATKQLMYKASVIIYKNEGRYKVLKSRY